MAIFHDAGLFRGSAEGVSQWTLYPGAVAMRALPLIDSSSGHADQGFWRNRGNHETLTI